MSSLGVRYSAVTYAGFSPGLINIYKKLEKEKKRNKHFGEKPREPKSAIGWAPTYHILPQEMGKSQSKGTGLSSTDETNPFVKTKKTEIYENAEV